MRFFASGQSVMVTMMVAPVAIVLRFIETINAHDVDALCDLMTEDHTFVDSHGNVERSREHMRNAWRGYLAMFPDYEISVDHTLVDSAIVVVLGVAQGTYSVDGRLVEANHWKIPAAWRAEVQKDLVSQWQVYSDNEPVFRIIESAKANS